MKGLHHVHLRKRHARGLEPFPARRAWMRGLDHVVLAAGIIAPIMTMPQILKIYLLEDASGVSVITWGTFALLDIPWVIYGIAHRSRPIIITYVLWFTMNAVVVVGALMYGASFL